MPPPTHLSRTFDHLGELGAHLRDLTGYRTLAHELIQNADDVEGCSEVAFDVRANALVVDNDGVFSACSDINAPDCHWRNEGRRRCDFHRFRLIAAGDKRSETGKTGAFGIGFISVYQITDRPELISAGQHWRLQEDAPADRRIEVCYGCNLCRGASLPGTRFVLPWAFDSSSELRAALKVPALDSKAPEDVWLELSAELSRAMLFLKRLHRLRLLKDGESPRVYDRIDEGHTIVLSDGVSGTDTTWHVFRGDFTKQAETLRQAHPGRIEDKREARVAIAVDESLLERGLLWACLPTEHSLHLPFQLNADFFPSVDRKRILFDKDYQAQWNRLALEGAARLLADNIEPLTRLLGHVRFWEFVKEVKTAAGSDEDAQPFWAALSGRLSAAPTLFSTTGQWIRAERTHLLQSAQEGDAITVLNGLGMELVHEDLRPYQPLIREVLGVPIVEISHIAQALTRAGLTRRRLGSDSSLPVCLHSQHAWEQLWDELVRLLARREPQPKAKAADQALLRPLAIAPGRDHSFWPCQELSVADEETIALFERLGISLFFVSEQPHFADLQTLCRPIDVSTAITALQGQESLIETRWRGDGTLLRDLFSWLERHRPAILRDESLKHRLGRLRIFPSASALHTLDELSLPGGFEDPLGLSGLIDLHMLGGRRDFLSDLGMKQLDLTTYVASRVPDRVTSGTLPPELLRALLTFLATKLGEFRGNDTVRNVLANLPIVEGLDGHFHSPLSSYFDNTTVRECLSGQYTIARLPPATGQSLKDLLLWLGVSEAPRLQDLVASVQAAVSEPPSPDRVGRVHALFRHLATRVVPGESQPGLDALRTLAWLPAQHKAERWHKPAELYALNLAHVFETTGTFLDVPRATQDSARTLLDFLGVRTNPPTALVVGHLLHCMRDGRPVHTDVYRTLNSQSEDASLVQLTGKACLWLDGAYRRPQDVFWTAHPFGRYRKRLGGDFSAYRALLDRLAVSESPGPLDAIAVIKDISHTFGTPNVPLDDDSHTVLLACWQFLERAMAAQSDLLPLAQLADTKCVPNANRLLMPPRWVYFENRVGLADRFEGSLAAHVIPRPVACSAAMSAAGVRSLGTAVQLDILEIVGSDDDSDMTRRLADRRASIARVLEAYSSGPALLDALDRLTQLACRRCNSVRIRYRLPILGRELLSAPELTQAVFDPQSSTLFHAAGTTAYSWTAVARELATALLPDEDPGRFAAGLKEVLAADGAVGAQLMLDELGFARLQDEAAAPPPVAEETGTLGEDPPVHTGGYNPAAQLHPTTANADIPTLPPPNGKDGKGERQGVHGHQGNRPPEGTRQRGKRRQEYWRSYAMPGDPDAQPSDAGAGQHLTRSAVDQAGVRRVLEYEKAQNRTPLEMAHGHPGYDIESCDEHGAIVRLIEVKSLSGPWDGTFAVLSRTQFDAARTATEEFWLYVVEYAERDDFRIYRVPNPARHATHFMFDGGWRDLGEEPPYPRNTERS